MPMSRVDGEARPVAKVLMVYGVLQDNVPQNGKRPEWFRENATHVSDRGIFALGPRALPTSGNEGSWMNNFPSTSI
jgi:hypothetical protein